MPETKRSRRRPKRSVRAAQTPECRTCKAPRPFDVLFYRGLCRDCRDTQAAQRRAATAARLLANAKPGGTETRGNQTFTITVLPPKRRAAH